MTGVGTGQAGVSEQEVACSLHRGGRVMEACVSKRMTSNGRGLLGHNASN